jgi:tetratricopeptide (TPR) repeat protein
MSEGSSGGKDSRSGENPGHAPEWRSRQEDTYSLYRRGLDLLGRGSPAAAAQLLERAAAAEPESRSILEALGRAQFDTRHYQEAISSFRRIVEASPSDDYAQFGLGLALARAGEHGAAAEHLALAAAMRPDLRHYTEALRGVRATLRARAGGAGAGGAGAGGAGAGGAGAGGAGAGGAGAGGAGAGDA